MLVSRGIGPVVLLSSGVPARRSGGDAALRTLGPLVITLAETEGLPAHADSVRLRLAALENESQS